MDNDQGEPETQSKGGLGETLGSFQQFVNKTSFNEIGCGGGSFQERP